MSRTLTFHDNATQPAHRTCHGVGFAGTGTLTSTQFLRQEARRRFADEEAVASYIDPVSVDNRSLALYGSYYSDHGFALSATLGTAVGIDATWQIWKRNYLTLSGSPGGIQASLSHRAFNSSFLEIVVGTGYRYERKFFDVENIFEREAPSSLDFPTDSVLPVHSGGANVSVVLRPGPEAPGVVAGRLYVGYAPAFQQPVVTFGITTGIF
jgi:hypothetical protein